MTISQIHNPAPSSEFGGAAQQACPCPTPEIVACLLAVQATEEQPDSNVWSIFTLSAGFLRLDLPSIPKSVSRESWFSTKMPGLSLISPVEVDPDLSPSLVVRCSAPLSDTWISLQISDSLLLPAADFCMWFTSLSGPRSWFSSATGGSRLPIFLTLLDASAWCDSARTDGSTKPVESKAPAEASKMLHPALSPPFVLNSEMSDARASTAGMESTKVPLSNTGFFILSWSSEAILQVSLSLGRESSMWLSFLCNLSSPGAWSTHISSSAVLLALNWTNVSTVGPNLQLFSSTSGHVCTEQKMSLYCQHEGAVVSITAKY